MLAFVDTTGHFSAGRRVCSAPVSEADRFDSEPPEYLSGSVTETASDTLRSLQEIKEPRVWRLFLTTIFVGVLPNTCLYVVSSAALFGLLSLVSSESVRALNPGFPKKSEQLSVDLLKADRNSSRKSSLNLFKIRRQLFSERKPLVEVNPIKTGSKGAEGVN